jgi:flagella basal body P-ring formation protein FlgA
MMRSIVAAAALAALAFFGCGRQAFAQPPMSAHISGNAIEALAKPALRSVRLSGDAALIPAFSVPDQTVPAGSVSLVRKPALATPSFVNVPVEVDVNGKYVRTIFVGYRVQQYVRTAVAAHDLVPGTILAPGDVEMARVAYTGQPGNSAQVLVGRKIVAAFRAGAPVYIESTQTNQIVKPGSSVVLIVHDGGVSIVAEVVARTGGGLGDEVSIYNPQTNKTLSGTVIGPDRVELNLSGDTQ